MQSLLDVWKENYTIGNTRWTLSGSSTAGIRTSFFCNELKILLDAGYQNYNKIKEIFITHCHADHIACLPLIILENIHNQIETNIYCPIEVVNLLENMIDSFLKCNYGSNVNHKKKYYKVIGMSSQYFINLNLNGFDIKLEIIDSDHTVPTISYGFIEIKKKLKEEYFGLKGAELAKLKQDGKDITNKVEEKKMIFCGDTSIYIFKSNPQILEYPNIIIECTFFDKDELPLAKDRKHMHWEQLKEIVVSNTNINFYIIHISAKYNNKQEIKLKYLKDFKNVFIL